LLLAAALPAQPLADRIGTALKNTATPRRGFWGVHVINLKTGESVYGSQHDRVFTPASTTKLFTTALALERLGPEHRFVTRVLAVRPPDSSGRIDGDLFFVGGGDPTLSGRNYPYKYAAEAGPPLRAVEELADALVARGLKRVEGDVAGDDTAYLWEPFARGQAQEDAIWEYGAPVSALSVNDNRIVMTISAGRQAGQPARISFDPAIEYFIVENRVRTAASGSARVFVSRLPGSRNLRVWGVMPLRAAPETRSLAVADPAEFAAAALRDALVRRGVTVGGKAVARHRFADEKQGGSAGSQGIELARRVSPPLIEILRVINKESVNLHAELVMREVGRIRRGDGSLQGGLNELADFLREAQIPAGEANLADASGLSTLNAVSPRAFTSLLAHMHRSPNGQLFRGTLAVGGEDGTLARRLTRSQNGRRIQAKTGAITRVSAMAGYAESPAGETLAFAILVNNYTVPAAQVRAAIDRICMLLVD